MNTTFLSSLYAVALHVLGIAALTVLTALDKIDPTTGVSLIAGMLGLGLGAGVTIAPQPAPAAPVVPVPVQAAPVTIGSAVPVPTPPAVVAVPASGA